MSEEMSDAALRRVKDGDVLFTLPNGLFFSRREKHEWKPFLAGLTGEELIRATDRRRGSKFTSAWTLSRYVTWLAAQVESLGWDRDTAPGEHVVEFSEITGVSSGQMVRKILIEISSGCVHAYPVR